MMRVGAMMSLAMLLGLAVAQPTVSPTTRQPTRSPTTDDEAPEEGLVTTSSPTVLSGERVSLLMSGDIATYTDNYFRVTLPATIRTALNVPASVAIVLENYRAGSVVVNMRVSGSGASSVANQINNQANTPGSALRNSLPQLLGTYNAPSGDDGLSDGAIAGIVIGTLVGVAIIGALLWFFCLKEKCASKESADPEGGNKQELEAGHGSPYPGKA
eukprot:Hpha_TRINITY_DN15131_c4_g4::TRINITY_DN15131_c4_g4_i1::g.128179::m.128179